ncbi:uncharacterized protein FFB20_02703 [Fusarium fujikuroi]|nr:uncharacterized protein FFB20_02703 [Fusarium fujikuroi]SCN83405.1 uncharacterized protein FFM5_03021 [Fusarium fujikuroi]SCN86284.1 uncharacterized protein FFC1_05112 [Fusarium fujikuroi]SCO23586.1 uncharacterized protein FFE2_15650 [Fusarium fujikuroi]SCO33687.1 uncharacterized protein FFNC_03377 [Fusarium fujikuroi]
MGCSLSKNPGTESQNDNTPPNVPAPGDRLSFPQPYQDKPTSIEDDNTFPLIERDIA